MIKKFASLRSNLKIALTAMSLSVLSYPVMASTDCVNLTGCERKFCEIEKQLKISQEQGNIHREAGLTTSLKNARKNCTNKGLKEDLAEEIREVNEDIAEYASDLKEAKEEGKADKIEKYQDKISEKQNKLKRLEDELSELD